MAGLWNAIDTYLLANLLTDLGATSEYLTLQVQSVNNTDQWTPDQWSLPAITFNGSSMEVEGQPHMDGAMHYDNLYPYVLAGVVTASTFAQARQDAKTLNARLQTFARDHFTLGGLLQDGETVTYLRMGSAEILAFPVKASKVLFYGVARVEIDIFTSI